MNTTTMPRQRGVTLILTLIFLAILAVLGVTAALNNTLQERMAGSTRNRDLALQAAEHALKDGATTLPVWRLNTFPSSGCTNGMCFYDATRANGADYWKNTSNWASYRSPEQSLNQVAEQPRYLVEKMPTVGTTEYYRITARGVGGDSNAVVVLQAVYKYENP